MDVDVLRALCSVCGEREVFDIGQETPGGNLICTRAIPVMHVETGRAYTEAMMMMAA